VSGRLALATRVVTVCIDHTGTEPVNRTTKHGASPDRWPERISEHDKIRTCKWIQPATR
jgi:hypothetical protein